jgi:hypothetical protein
MKWPLWPHQICLQATKKLQIAEGTDTWVNVCVCVCVCVHVRMPACAFLKTP